MRVSQVAQAIQHITLCVIRRLVERQFARGGAGGAALPAAAGA
ncbi:MAG: hypothetical protein U0Z44_14345 [Kouleothrix sp.]